MRKTIFSMIAAALLVLLSASPMGCGGPSHVSVGVMVPMGGPWGPYAYPPPGVWVGRPY